VSGPGGGPDGGADHPHRPGLLARTGPAAGVAFAGGALFGLQTRVNGELAARAGSPLWAALVSFGSGLVVLLVVVAAVPRLRRAAARATRNRLPWWTYLGGLAGGTVVALSSLAVPRVGVATFTVGIVAGQAVGGLAVDRIGLGPGGPQPLSGWRIAGAAVAIVAVAILRLGHGREAAVSGAMASAQQALNGRVQRATGEGLLAATVNFSVGMALLVPAFVIAAGAGHGPGTPWPPALWLYAGGVLGIAYIASSIWTVGTLGVLRLGLLLVAGQLAGGVVIDLVSPGRTGPPGAATYAAVVLTLAAVLIAGRGQSRSRRITSASATATKITR
jgi:bacterial/archaeal transporter family-2 protein